MPWIRVDDGYADHPKMAAVGPLGQALWLSGLAYCNRNLTDGFIPWTAARRLVSWTFLDRTGLATIYIGAPDEVSEEGEVTSTYVIALLVDVGLWREADGGYVVHDYGDYQPTKAQVLAERAQKVAAGRAGGLAAAQARAVAPAKAGAVAGAQAESKPVPNPNPKPVPVPKPLPKSEGAREEIIENGHDERLDGPLAYSEVTLRYPSLGSDLHSWTVRLAEEHGAAAFQTALATEFTINRSGKDLMSRTESRLARAADAARPAPSKGRADETRRLLDAEAERRSRLLTEPMKPLRDLMPDVKLGKAP